MIALTVIVVANTLGLAVRVQHRDLALLRSIAASPAQVRRLVRRQAQILTLAVSPVGWFTGSKGAALALDALRDRGFGAGVTKLPSPIWPAVLATAVTALVSTVAAMVAVRRIAGGTPSAALVDQSTGAARMGWLRWGLGLVTAASAGAATFWLLRDGRDAAAQASLLVMIVLLLAVALLGPVISRCLGGLLGVPLRMSSRTGWLAATSVRSHAQRLSSAVVPVALLCTVGFVFLSVGPIIEQAGIARGADLGSLASANDRRLRTAELALLAAFISIAVVNTLVAATSSRRSELLTLVLIGATRREVMSTVLVEAVLTAVVGIVTGAAVAAVTLVIFTIGATGSHLVSIPVGASLGVVAVAVSLVVPTIGITAALLLRGSPIGALAGTRR